MQPYGHLLLSSSDLVCQLTEGRFTMEIHNTVRIYACPTAQTRHWDLPCRVLDYQGLQQAANRAGIFLAVAGCLWQHHHICLPILSGQRWFLRSSPFLSLWSCLTLPVQASSLFAAARYISGEEKTGITIDMQLLATKETSPVRSLCRCCCQPSTHLPWRIPRLTYELKAIRRSTLSQFFRFPLCVGWHSLERASRFLQLHSQPFCSHHPDCWMSSSSNLHVRHSCRTVIIQYPRSIPYPTSRLADTGYPPPLEIKDTYQTMSRPMHGR